MGTLQSLNDCIYPLRLRLNALIEDLRRSLTSLRNRALRANDGRPQLVDGQYQWNGKSMLPRYADHTIEVDASDLGMGAVSGEERRLGRSSPIFRRTHINVRELMAAFYGLRCFAHHFNWRTCKVLIRTDNLTFLSYLNRMGGRVKGLTRLGEELGQPCPGSTREVSRSSRAATVVAQLWVSQMTDSPAPPSTYPAKSPAAPPPPPTKRTTPPARHQMPCA